MDGIIVAIRNGLLFFGVVALVPAASYALASTAYALTRPVGHVHEERVACDEAQPPATVCD
jgi:hypothetical protein